MLKTVSHVDIIACIKAKIYGKVMKTGSEHIEGDDAMHPANNFSFKLGFCSILFCYSQQKSGDSKFEIYFNKKLPELSRRTYLTSFLLTQIVNI